MEMKHSRYASHQKHSWGQYQNVGGQDTSYSDRVNDLDFQIPFKAGNSHAALLYGK